VRDGIVACPNRFPFGTIVEINGKVYVCYDRMNDRYADGNYFDIFMWNLEDAIRWGRRTLQVKVIKSI
jgi:3D (Asp-Asp-Asp) domain-containing protein